MGKRGAGLGAVAVGAALLGAPPLRADVPPPPGQARVTYTARVVGEARGVALVAFPTYVPSGGTVERVTPGQELRFFQGYTPGLYSLPAEAAAALAGQSGEAVERALAQKAHRCLEHVPRVFQVPSATRISAITDVLRVEATPEGCRASLVTTAYAGEHGERGEGGIDAAGRRLPPPPFGREGLPPVAGLAAERAGASSAAEGCDTSTDEAARRAYQRATGKAPREDGRCFARAEHFPGVVVAGAFAYDRGCRWDPPVDACAPGQDAAPAALARAGWAAADPAKRGELAARWVAEALRVPVLHQQPQAWKAGVPFAAPAARREGADTVVALWSAQESGDVPEHRYVQLEFRFGPDGAVSPSRVVGQLTVPVR